VLLKKARNLLLILGGVGWPFQDEVVELIKGPKAQYSKRLQVLQWEASEKLSKIAEFQICATR